MLGKMNKMLRNRKGFTLIELIVVIAILGILAAVAVPRLSGFTDTAKVKANEGNLAMIQNAVRVYEAEEGGLPTVTALEGTKYLGQSIPVPIITKATGVKGAAAASTYFVMDSNGVVTIGTDGTKLSGVSATK